MKKEGLLVFCLFLSFGLFSCVNLIPGSGGVNVEQINMDNLPEVIIPISPVQAEIAYDEAEIFINQKILVPHSDSKPDLYYVVIFVTNISEVNKMIQCFVPYSVLPMPGFETNEEMLEFFENADGVFSGKGYSNVMPYYALITSKHYNEFLMNHTFVFKPIRKVSYTELSNMGGLDISFINEYTTRIEECGWTNTNSTKGFFDWLQAIWGNISDALGGIGAVLVEKTKCHIHFKYSKPDSSMQHKWVEGIYPDINVKFHYANGSIGSFSKRIDQYGNIEIDLPKNTTYKMFFELFSYYACYTYNHLGYGWIFDRYYYTKDSTEQFSEVVNIQSDGIAYSALMGIFYELNTYAKSFDLDPGQVWIEAVELGNKAGMATPFGIDIDLSYQYNKEVCAHEYGHYIHMMKSSLGELFRLDWEINTRPINFPDGTTDPIYSSYPNVLKQEAWAEFFAVTFLINRYGGEAIEKNNLCKILEANFGSKEVLFASETQNFNSIGRSDDYYLDHDYYLYRFDFIRYYKEASILYDLWDKNEYSEYFDQYLFLEYGNQAKSITTYRLIGAFFNDGTEFTNTFFLNSAFNKNAIITREKDLDKVSLSIKEIFEYLKFSIIYYDKTLEECLPLGIPEINNMLGLHSSDYPVYSPNNKPLNIINTINPDASIRISWSAIPFIDGYYVYKYTNNFYIERFYTTGLNYIDKKGLKSGLSYQYRVTAVSGGAESPQSDLTTTLPIPIPQTPIGFSAIASVNGSISLSWNSVSGALSYIITRNAPGLSEKKMFLTSLNYIDTNLVTNKTYSYTIMISNYSGYSTNSVIKSITPLLPNNPNNLTISALTLDLVRLSWDTVNGANQYLIQRVDVSNSQIMEFTTINNWFVDSTIQNDKLYQYKVWAKNILGKSTSYSAINVQTPNTDGVIVSVNTPSYMTNLPSAFIMQGLATSGGVFPADNVYYKFNTGGFSQVSVDTNATWNISVSNLSIGQNTLYIYCVDSGGNSSLTNTIPFVVYPRAIYMSSFGSFGSIYTSYGQSSLNILISSNNLLFIFDAYAKSIKLFNTNGVFIRSWNLGMSLIHPLSQLFQLKDGYFFITGAGGSIHMLNTNNSTYSMAPTPLSVTPLSPNFSCNAYRFIFNDFYSYISDYGSVYSCCVFIASNSTYLSKIILEDQMAEMDVFGNNIYVLDKNKIKIYNASANLLNTLNNITVGNNPYGNEESIIVDENFIYICDPHDTYKIKIFNHQGTKLYQFGLQGSAVGQFNAPTDIKKLGNYIIIADAGNNRIQKFLLY
ncbi:MAG: hypothetical protein A2Y33_11465 [Spirochaetes bacterium GWF1_51_8]|nr:MAG: hypothetical protein A2Y33_11465 [Spirochaetes bacterium GWF1_51_8]